jgi:pimeloyl-ACP methyl ester carboxylesterase
VRQRAAFDGARDDFISAMRSVVVTAGDLWRQAYRRELHSVTCPVLLVHGQRDRLVPASAARGAAKANPSWSLVELPDVGHVPQLEAPRETAAAIKQWLGSEGQQAAKLTTGSLMSSLHPAWAA